MAKKETIQYSVDGKNYYTRSEYCNKHNIDKYTFVNMLNRNTFYKKVNGVKFEKVHIANNNKCIITFTDCAEKTTVIKMNKRVFSNNGNGDYMVKYTDINGNNVIMYMTSVEFNTMFGFLIVFRQYANIEMDKKKIISRFGKGVHFI